MKRDGELSEMPGMLAAKLGARVLALQRRGKLRCASIEDCVLSGDRNGWRLL